MAIREIRVVGDRVLTKKCRPVEKMTPRISELIDDMFDTMYEACLLYTSFHLRQHGVFPELAFCDVFLRVSNGDVLQRFFVRGTVVDGNVFHAGQDHQHVCVQHFCHQAAGEVFFDDCGCTL